MINTIQKTIKNTIRNTLGDDAFTILDLFANGQRGAWYDPSDLATMYQESTGGTAVTADGQPVGLMYDKSRGDLFGDELVTNIDGSNGTVGWYSPRDASTLSVVNNKITSTANISDTFGVAQQIDNLDVTKDYIFTMEVSTSAFTTIYLRVSPNVIVDGNFVTSSNGAGGYTHKIIAEFKPLDSTVYLGSIIVGGTAGTTATIDNVSVKEVLGTTATQPVATKRPTYKNTPDRLEIDLVDDALLFDVPTGGIDGYMVIGTSDGTASYGVSLPAGSYELGGDYFPSNTINGFLLREGLVSQSDLAKVEKNFVSKGAKASYGDVTSFSSYWRSKNITEFPLIDTSSGTTFISAWYGNNLTSFPLIDTSNGTSFASAWRDNNLTSFPLIDTSSGTNFSYAWRNNPNLTDFPANMFDNCNATNFFGAFASTNLSQSSIDGILVSIESNGTSNGTFGQSGGSAPSATGEAAIDAMRSRGWTIIVTGGY